MAKKKPTKKYKKRKYTKRKKIKISKKIWALWLIPILLLVLLVYLVIEDNKNIGNDEPKHSYLSEIAEDTVKIYLVDKDGTTISTMEVKKGSNVEEPTPPSKSGYKFVEWQNDGIKFDFTQPITKNITLIAVWKNLNKKEYTVTFDSKGGTSISSQIIEEGNKIVKPIQPKKSGYRFVEWQLNGKKYNFDSIVKKDITLVAVWNSTKEKYTVTFNSNGGTSIATQTIEEGEKVTIPASPTKENYTFIEWQLNGNNFDFNTKIDKDIILTAKWEENKEE